jgi:hypothetical protein
VHNPETTAPNPAALPAPRLLGTTTSAFGTISKGVDTIDDTVEQTIGKTTEVVDSTISSAREIVDPIVPDTVKPVVTGVVDPILPAGQPQEQTSTGGGLLSGKSISTPSLP